MVNTLSGMNGWNGSFAASHFVRLSARKLASDGAGFYPAPFIIEVSQIVVEKGHQPDLVLDLSDAHGLASESGREVDFASADADATAASDADGAIVERVFWRSWRLVDARLRCIEIARVGTVERLVRSFVIVNPDELVAAFLLLQEVEGGGLRSLLLEGQVHALMAAVLLRMARLDALQADA